MTPNGPSHARHALPRLCIAAGSLFWPVALAGDPPGRLSISPPECLLRGPEGRQRLIVTLEPSDASPLGALDVTREVEFRSETPHVAQVSLGGIVHPTGEGLGVVVASRAGEQARALIHVAELDSPRPVSFALEVEPVLARAGCSSGPCHGKARGQNGFQLSLLGFDPDFDHRALTHDLGGRRISPIEPERSLILLKGSAAIPHGGGKRLEEAGPLHGTIHRWIREGAARRVSPEAALVDLRVEPTERVLAPRSEQQLLVTARFSDGRKRDVTHLAAFLSSESVIASVDEHGLVRAGPLPGDVAILARFLGRAVTVRVTIPLPGKVPHSTYAGLPRKNFIDDLVWKQLERLGITPSAPAADSTFLRRAYLDVIGRLPAPDEARSFLAGTAADKRERLLESLLERPEYADHWASKWADHLRPNPYRVGIKAVLNFDAWIRDAFRRNLPFDRFAREVLTARGSTFEPGAATLYRDRRSPDEVLPLLSQLFLGLRLECAKCHRHPFESYGQDEFYSLAAYFSRVGYKGTGLSPPISGGEEMVFASPSGAVRHPATGAEMKPRTFFGSEPSLDPLRDPREAFADWVLEPGNPYFAHAAVNRVWADLMGVGLVEPVDDLRPTNPPSNPALLDALAKDFRANSFDVKRLLRTILSSHVYGLASKPSSRNASDTRNYSRHYRQRLRAEAVVDAVSDITGIAEPFSALPPGSRAQEIWTHRTESISLDAFGRPDPNQDPPCQRMPDTSLVQALHLMNSRRFHEKITSDAGRAARLARSQKSAEEIVEEVYLLVYARFPTEAERRNASRLFEEAGAGRRKACEDLLWALINTPEFLFKD